MLDSFFKAAGNMVPLGFRRYIFGFDDLSSFFYRALCYQAEWARQGVGPPAGNYYEFGVGWGGTFISYIRALKAFCKDTKKDVYSYNMFGFDSFEGLPKKKSLKDNHPSWHAKCFSHSLSEIKQKVSEQGIDLKRGNIHFIKGFFEKTLTPSFRNKLRKWAPSIVTIDVDYYSSAKTVLKWLRPILTSGTIFYFDDIWAFHGNPNYGELAAINEFNEAGEGYLTPYPILGRIGSVFIYSKKEFEFKRAESF